MIYPRYLKLYLYLFCISVHGNGYLVQHAFVKTFCIYLMFFWCLICSPVLAEISCSESKELLANSLLFVMMVISSATTLFVCSIIHIQLTPFCHVLNNLSRILFYRIGGWSSPYFPPELLKFHQYSHLL